MLYQYNFSKNVKYKIRKKRLESKFVRGAYKFLLHTVQNLS